MSKTNLATALAKLETERKKLEAAAETGRDRVSGDPNKDVTSPGNAGTAEKQRVPQRVGCQGRRFCF